MQWAMVGFLVDLVIAGLSFLTIVPIYSWLPAKTDTVRIPFTHASCLYKYVSPYVIEKIIGLSISFRILKYYSYQ